MATKKNDTIDPNQQLQLVTIDGTEKLVVILDNVHSSGILSKSEKSIRVAGTGGNITTGCMIDGKPIKIGVNAYVSAT